MWIQLKLTASLQYSDITMSMMVSQITSVSIVYHLFWPRWQKTSKLRVTGHCDDRKYQSSASLAFVRGIHRWPVNSPHKGPVMQKMLPFDDVIMFWPVNIYHHSGAQFRDLIDHLEVNVVSTVPDGEAWNARPFAGTIMTMIWVYICTMHVCNWHFNSVRPSDAYMHL